MLMQKCIPGRKALILAMAVRMWPIGVAHVVAEDEGTIRMKEERKSASRARRGSIPEKQPALTREKIVIMVTTPAAKRSLRASTSVVRAYRRRRGCVKVAQRQALRCAKIRCACRTWSAADALH